MLCLFVAVPLGRAQELAPAPASVPRGVRVMEVNGAISAALVPKIRAALDAVEPDRFPAGAIVLLDSQGGDGLAAIEIGRIVRAARAHVFVRGRCASACTYVLAGGVVRGVARDQAVGIHSPRLTTFVKGIGMVDINSASNPNAARALEAGNQRSKDYFTEMGMPETLYTAMMAAPSDQTRYLDRAELAALSLAGIDPAYREARVPAAAAYYRISEDEYVRRTLAMPEICLAARTPAQEFARCYRRVLQTGG